MVVVMTTMTVMPMTTTPTTMVKMTMVLEAVSGGGRDLRRHRAWPEHKSLESTRRHSLDMLQQNILILEQHENLVATRHGDPFRKTGRIP
jgi:hypothetical protein